MISSGQDLKQSGTKALSDELINRSGITHLILEPHEEMKMTTDHMEKTIQGPAIIIINQD